MSKDPFNLRLSIDKKRLIEFGWYLNVIVPKSYIAILQTPIFEWYVVRCEIKDKQQKDMSFKKIGL